MGTTARQLFVKRRPAIAGEDSEILLAPCCNAAALGLIRQALMELGSSAALQAAERAQQLEPKDAKVLELYLGDWSVARGMGK